MKKLFLLLILSSISASGLFAQYKHQSGSAVFNLGYASLTPKGEDVDLTGFTANFDYEYLNLKKFLSYGFSISYIEGTGSNTEAAYKYHSWPFTFMMKGYLGGDKIRGYIRAQAGFHSTTAQKEGPLALTQVWDTGLTAGGGLGVNFLVSERIFLNLEYNANWLDTNIYDGQIAHVIQVGIGIQEK